MARARRRNTRTNEPDFTPVAQRTIPEVCPVCQQSLPRTPDEAARHLQQHAPMDGCRNCGEKHVGWKIDWDLIQYPRPDVTIFYCDPCGWYTPVTDGEKEGARDA
jgi:hypothetical protein